MVKAGLFWKMCLEILILIIHAPIYLDYEYKVSHRKSSHLKGDPNEDSSGKYYIN